jgi:TctA family transporter
MEKSREFDINCHYCGVVERKHVNDVKAQNNDMIIIIGIVIGIVVTIGLWLYFGAIGTISLIIPILFWKQEKKAVKSFNSYLIKR